MQYENGCDFASANTQTYSRCMTIGTKLDEAMKACGFKSQKALERASGVPQATISRILSNGGAKGPETKTLQKLAKACRVPYEWFLAESHDGDAPPTEAANDAASDQELIADDIIELVRLFRYCMPEDRRMLMESARDAQQRNSTTVFRSSNNPK